MNLTCGLTRPKPKGPIIVSSTSRGGPLPWWTSCCYDDYAILRLQI